jgi:hypothetical protein
MAVSLSSCDKDSDEGDGNGDLYKPSESMSSEEILTLFEEVNANMETVRQVSMEVKSTTSDGDEVQHTAQFDLDAKKEVEIGYEDGDGEATYFIYTENTTAYEYENAVGSSGTRYSYKVSDAYWNGSTHVSELEDAFDLEWEVESNTFVGSIVQSGYTRKMTITLTSDKKIASIKKEQSNSGRTTEIKYAYSSVNPTFPSGFSKSDFPLASQYSVRVVWGEELGESTFYTYPNSDYIDLYDIIDYAPKVQGKEPVRTLYSNSQFTLPYVTPIKLTNNNVVIYIKWVESTSEKKSVSNPAAKSLLKKLSSKL